MVARRRSMMSSPKRLLMFVNFLTALSGVLLLALSIFGMTAQARTSTFYSTNVPTYVLILSIALISTSVLGFIGTSQDNPTALKAYLTLVVIVFVLQVILGSVALARESDVGAMAYDAWEDAYLHHPGQIERLEKTFQCCGYSSLTDRPVPEDCSISRNFGYIESCRPKLVDAGVSVLRGLGITLMVIAGLEILAVFLAMYMFYVHSDELEHDMPHAAHEARTLIRETVNPGYQPISRTG